MHRIRFTVFSAFLLSALAFSTGCFTSTVDAPTFSVSSSGIVSKVSIASGASGASLFYTLDGTTATMRARAYSSPITVAGYGVSTTVNAIAVASGAVSEDSSKTVSVAAPALAITGTLATFAGTGGSGSTNDSATAATFYHPSDITTDGTSLFVADSGNNLIRRIDISTGAVTTFAGSGSAAEADGTGTGASFNGPTGITTDGTNLYVTDTIGCTVRRVVIATGAVTTIAGSGWYGCDDGTGTSARFASPMGIATVGEYLYVADYSGNAIRKITVSSGCVTTFAGSGNSLETDGIGTKAAFKGPRGIATDGTNLYVTDYLGQTVRQVVLSTGAVTTVAGTAGTADVVDGSGGSARFSGPAGILTDGTNLYVTDLDGDAFRRVVISGGVVTTLFSDADYANYPGNDHFKALCGMTTDGATIYLTEMDANVVHTVK